MLNNVIVKVNVMKVDSSQVFVFSMVYCTRTTATGTVLLLTDGHDYVQFPQLHAHDFNTSTTTHY